MIRLGKLTDYGVGLMTRLAGEGAPAQMTARDLSESMGLSLPTVSKILKQLSKADLLVSQRGAAGGYSLSRSPERITLADIVGALEGPLALTECSNGGACSCQLQLDCGLQDQWSGISRQIQATLEGVTLAQMAAAAPQCKQ